MSEMDRTTQLMIATGIAGYAIAMGLLTTLRDLGALSDETLLDVVDGALNNVEAIDAERQHELYWLARDSYPRRPAYRAPSASPPAAVPDLFERQG